MKCIVCQTNWAGPNEICCQCRLVAFPANPVHGFADILLPEHPSQWKPVPVP